MADHTTFLLTSSSSVSSASPTLNLLPFSLGSSSKPYASTSAPVSSYFQPRPCPPSHSHIPQDTPIAAFRGRQLVGQRLEIPPGYHGVILKAAKRPDQGGLEERSAGKAGTGTGVKQGKWPLTPATSIASSSSDPSVASSTSVGHHDEAEAGVRRSPRKLVKGMGQVALAKPKMRLMKKVEKRKRLRFDSDSEEEDQQKRPIVGSTVVDKTPQKGKRRMVTTPVKAQVPQILPEIVVQAPTPRKPDMEDQDAYGGIVETSTTDESQVAATEDPIIPSPSTESDPPSFILFEGKLGGEEESAVVTSEPSKTPPRIDDGFSPPVELPVVKSSQNTTPLPPVVQHVVNGELKDHQEEETEEDGTVRRLHPVSTFREIMLWTPDAALPGFRPDELSQQDVTDDAKEGDDGSLGLRKGWWRVGGAGEGGDEFVRGMGEWLGLVEMVSPAAHMGSSS